jgi:hypothetical protein
MITRIEKTTNPLSYSPKAVRIRLWGISVYRREREWPTDKIWVLGILVYCSEAQY